MILNRTGAEFEYEGVTYTIGGAIVGTAESEYAGLYGRINAIHDGEDKETENETPDIYCEFDPPVMPHEVKTLEDTFSDLYHQPKTIADIVLDMVIMAPEMIRPLDDLRSMRKRVNVFLVMEDWAVDGEHGNDCEAFSDYDDAKRIMTNRIREELEDGIISSTDVLKDDSFTNESGYVLLTFLLLNRKREHPLRLLTDVIWESTDMGNPYNSIKNVVYRLRKTLACIGLRDLIQASHGTFTLNPNYTIFTDVERFDDACKRIDNSSDPAILQALYESIIGLYRGSLLPRYDFYHWLMPKTLYYQNKFLHYMKRYLSMLYREKNYLRVQELSMDLLSIDMYESEVHYYLIKAMLMSGSKTLSQIYFRQAEPYLTDEHMQEVKTLFTSCRT